VRGRDELDDRQPEPGPTAAARLVGAAEAVERALPELVREAGAGIADVKLHQAVPFLGPQHDRAAAVGEGVVDEVHERLARAERIGVDVEVRLLDSKLPAERARPVREAQRRVGEEVTGRDDLAPDR
jgi:hypothetical protein